MKNLKIKTKLTIAMMSIAMIFFSLSSCKKKESLTTNEGYGKVKSDNWRDLIDNEVTVEGYVVSEGGSHLAKLVTQPEKYLVDAIIPETDYILLEVNSDLANQIVLGDYHGKKVRITGVLKATSDRSMNASSQFLGDKSLAQVKIDDPSKLVIIDNNIKFGRPTYLNFCDRYPIICDLSVTIGNKTALLYSGGVNASSAYYRYWNDLKFMYNTLRANGYSAANIRVVYKDGTGEDTDIPVDYAANPNGFNDAVDYLKGRMNSNSQFFFMMNNHGGPTTDANGDDNRGGINDNLDENYCYYNSSAIFLDDTIAAKINRMSMKTMIVVSKPCYSGGIIWDLRGTNRVILTSGTEFQVTYPNLAGTFGELTYNFLSAINGKFPDAATTVDADTNNDGKVSMYEAYIYIKNTEHRNEQPQFSDDGTGTATTSPSSSGFGAGVFL